MQDDVLVQILKRQFGAAFDVLAGAIPEFMEDEWRSGRPPFDGPARCVAHNLQCAEFYTNPEGDAFGNLGKKVWEMTDDELPSAEDMAVYLEQTRVMTMGWIDDIAAAGLDQPSGPEETIGLERIIYAMRHLQHHAGEVCAYQKQFDHDQSQWA